jgi:hypothetical protein
MHYVENLSGGARRGRRHAKPLGRQRLGGRRWQAWRRYKESMTCRNRRGEFGEWGSHRGLSACGGTGNCMERAVFWVKSSSDTRKVKHTDEDRPPQQPDRGRSGRRLLKSGVERAARTQIAAGARQTGSERGGGRRGPTKPHKKVPTTDVDRTNHMARAVWHGTGPPPPPSPSPSRAFELMQNADGN